MRQTGRDRLLVAWAFGTACLLHSSSVQILLTSHLDADILPMIPPLPSTGSWKLLAHMGHFPSGWSSLHGPNGTSTGQKCIWHQALIAAGCAVSPKLLEWQPVASFIAEAGGDCSVDRWFLVGRVPEAVCLPADR